MRDEKYDIKAHIRAVVLAEIEFQRAHLKSAGLYYGEVAPHSYEVDGLDRFLYTLGKDDDAAAEAAINLVHCLSNAARGTVSGYLMTRAGMAPRPRSAMLKEAWIAGKSGSVLALHTGKSVLIELFRAAVPDVLMEPREVAALQSLPDSVTVYRGLRTHKAVRGLSWTRDRETARWFATHGHGSEYGRVHAAEIPRSGIFALWEESGREPEIVINPRRLRNVRVFEDYIEDAA